jgi:CheY-like chemotaxis protein
LDEVKRRAIVDAHSTSGAVTILSQRDYWSLENDDLSDGEGVQLSDVLVAGEKTHECLARKIARRRFIDFDMDCLEHSKEDVAMNSPTLLCIDDLPQALELRKATLESKGYSVELASNGYDAIKILEEASVAAVLLEYRQEGIDVEAVACHLKQRFPSFPIILLSAYCEMPESILWLVDDYVMKSELPERLPPILERVQERLGERGERQ